MSRRVRGYTDMGRIRIPPLPRGIVFTDRDDGTLWLLGHTTDPAGPDGYGYVTLNDTFSARENARVYDAYDGPLLGKNPLIRLLVRGGQLGYEMVDMGVGTHDIDQARVLSRNGNRGDFSDIIVPTSWQRFDDTLAWEHVEF